MLDKIEEYSIKIWNPIEDVFNYLNESSNIWVPIILFFTLSLLSVYLLHQLINKVLSIKLSFTNVFSFLVKTTVVLIIAAVIFSLGFYLYSQYDKHQKKVFKQEHNFGYLLK